MTPEHLPRASQLESDSQIERARSRVAVSDPEGETLGLFGLDGIDDGGRQQIGRASCRERVSCCV